MEVIGVARPLLTDKRVYCPKLKEEVPYAQHCFTCDEYFGNQGSGDGNYPAVICLNTLDEYTQKEIERRYKERNQTGKFPEPFSYL